MTPTDRRDLVRFLIDRGTAPDAPEVPARRPPRPFGSDVPIRPRAPRPCRPPRLAGAGQSRSDLRLLRQGGRLLPHARIGAAAPAGVSRPRRRRIMGTGGTRMTTSGPTAAGTGPTSAGLLSGVFRGGGRRRSPRGSASGSATAASCPPASTPRRCATRPSGPAASSRSRPIATASSTASSWTATPLPAPVGTTPDSSVRLPRVLPARRPGDLRLSDRRRGISRMPPGSRDGPVHPRSSRRRSEHPLASPDPGRPAAVAAGVETAGMLGRGRGPTRSTRSSPPFENPWNALMFFGGHDFLPDGSAMLCTMQGDVWRRRGARFEPGTCPLATIRFGPAPGARPGRRRTGTPYVLGRDQITRLHDLDGDGEADFYECVSNAYQTSPAGHDFICGLQRDADGDFYTASGKQGVIRIPADGRPWRCWPPASQPRRARPRPGRHDHRPRVPRGTGSPPRWSARSARRAHYGYRGPKDGIGPRTCPCSTSRAALDNSSGGQVFAPTTTAGARSRGS